MLEHIFFAFWFFGPVGLANVSAFFSSKIPVLKKYNYPVDFNLKFRNKRILGSHKTVRGFVFGILMSILGVSFQIFLYNHVAFFREVETIDYNAINPFLFGFLCGFGALFGDAVKSFFKRRAGIVPGRSWAPFDQIDYIIGGILFTFLYIQLSWMQYLSIFVLWSIIHPLGTFAGFLVKLRRKPI